MVVGITIKAITIMALLLLLSILLPNIIHSLIKKGKDHNLGIWLYRLFNIKINREEIYIRTYVIQKNVDDGKNY